MYLYNLNSQQKSALLFFNKDVNTFLMSVVEREIGFL